MKEIKFRAWDSRHKTMYPFELIELPYSANVNLDGQFDGLIDRDYIFMQYTGLLDNNGVEIYEGDIVTIMDWEPCLYKICYWKDTFKWGVEYIGNVTTIWQCENLEEFSGEEFEVVGNIYENPELLHVKE